MAPRVPRRRVPQTQQRGVRLPARLPAQPVVAFGAAEGAARQELGQSVQNLSSALLDGAAALKNRQDAVARAQDVNAFRKAMGDAFTKEVTEESAFAGDEELNAFSKFGNDTIAQILGNHKGSTLSRLALSEMLTKERGRFTEAAVTESLKTQRNAVNREMQATFTQHADMAARAPELATTLFQDVDDTVRNFAGALDPQQEDVARKLGRQIVTVGALDTLMARGQYDKADSVLSNSAEFMDPKLTQQYRNRIIVQRTSQARKMGEVRAMVESIRGEIESQGALSDPRLALGAHGITLPAGVKATPTQQFKQALETFEKEKGRAPNDQEKDDMFFSIVLEGRERREDLVRQATESIEALRTVKQARDEGDVTQEEADGILRRLVIKDQAASNQTPLDQVRSAVQAWKETHGGEAPTGDNLAAIMDKFTQDFSRANRKLLPSEQIREIRKAYVEELRIPWTNEVAQRVADKLFEERQKQNPLFGTGTRGRALSILVSLTDKYRAGETNAFEDQMFEAAAGEIMSEDEITKRRGQLPPAVRDAFAIRGINPDDLGNIQGRSVIRETPIAPTTPTAQPATQPAPTAQETGQVAGAQAQPGQAPVQPAGAQPQPGAEGETGAQEGTQDITLQLEAHMKRTKVFEPTGGMLAPEAPRPPLTLFETAELLTGPISGFRSAVAQTPVVGEFFSAPQVLRARRFMETWKKDLVRILQNNPRFPEGERKAIENSIQIESRFFQEPQAFKDELIGLDDALRFRAEVAQQMMQDSSTPADVRKAAGNVLSGVQAARDVLGVPPLFDSPADAEAAFRSGVFQLGKPYRLPTGELRVLRSKKQAQTQPQAQEGEGE